MRRLTIKRLAGYVIGAAVALFAVLVGIGLVTGPVEYKFKNSRGIFTNVEGRWDWTTRKRPCSDSAHVIAFSDDHKVMTITQVTRMVDSTGRDWTVTTYDVLESTGSRIRGAIRGETRKTADSVPVVWDLIVVNENAYQWHRTDWRSFMRTGSVVRCPTPDILSADPKTAEEEAKLPPLAEYYRGTVSNAQLGNHRLLLELSMFNRTDSTSGGWLASAAPLDIKGKTYALATGNDSLYFVTNTLTGDTIVWGSRTKTGPLGGEYWIRSGPNVGQGGSWRLDPAPRMPVTALALISAFIATVLIFGLVALAMRFCESYWAWRARRAVTITEEQRHRMSRIGGWLLLLIIGQSIVAVMQTALLNSVPEALGSTWMLAAGVPGMRPILLVESAYHFFQIVGIVCGLVLMFRKSPITPPYWIGFLLALTAYALGDVVGVAALRPAMVAAYPTMAEGSATDAGAATQVQNLRLVMFSLIWTLYWLRSRRVAILFVPGATEPSAAATGEPTATVSPA